MDYPMNLAPDGPMPWNEPPTLRERFEDKIWHKADSCHNAKDWFDPLEGGGRYVDGLLNALEEIVGEHTDDLAIELAEANHEIEILRQQLSLMHDATIVLRNGMGGHSHWDSTQQHGAGCPVCIDQRTAKSEATRLIDAAAALSRRDESDE